MTKLCGLLCSRTQPLPASQELGELDQPPRPSEPAAPRLAANAPPPLPRDPEQRTLASAVYRMRNPRYGELTLTRAAKSSDAKRIMFDIAFSHRGQDYHDKHGFSVCTHDERHGQRSTLSYFMIDLEEKMQRKGIGYLLHLAAAEAAQSLDVALVAVDNVLVEGMERACERMGMRFGPTPGDFEAEPARVKEHCEAGLKRYGWLLDTPASTRTQLSSGAWEGR